MAQLTPSGLKTKLEASWLFSPLDQFQAVDSDQTIQPVAPRGLHDGLLGADKALSSLEIERVLLCLRSCERQSVTGVRNDDIGRVSVLRVLKIIT